MEIKTRGPKRPDSRSLPLIVGAKNETTFKKIALSEKNVDAKS
ncbi:MAG: hypothetical protein NVSMB14_13840 [Isosphaeraceae bacterium]